MQSTRTCSFEGCSRRYEARGYCHTHYVAKRRSGELNNTNRPLGLSAEQAFLWHYKQMPTAPDTGCVQWTGSCMSNGYGLFRHGGKLLSAHRMAFEIACGPIPNGMLVDHICRNRSCVNALHLRLATKAQNGENQGIRADNTSGMRGVWFDQRQGRWVAGIMAEGKRMQGGSFHDFEDACDAVIALRAKHYKYAEEEFYRAA